jgi:hypothetical protein
MNRHAYFLSALTAMATLTSCQYKPSIHPDTLKCTDQDGCPSGYRCVIPTGSTVGLCCPNSIDDLTCAGRLDAAVDGSKTADGRSDAPEGRDGVGEIDADGLAFDADVTRETPSLDSGLSDHADAGGTDGATGASDTADAPMGSGGTDASDAPVATGGTGGSGTGGTVGSGGKAGTGGTVVGGTASGGTRTGGTATTGSPGGAVGGTIVGGSSAGGISSGGATTGGSATGGINTGGMATGGAGMGGSVTGGTTTGSTEPCSEGAKKCTTSGLQTCSGGQWSLPSCPTHQTCTGSDATAECTCIVDEVCSKVGEFCASSTTRTTCQRDSNLCFYRTSTSDCDSGQVCWARTSTKCFDANWSEWPMTSSLGDGGTAPPNYTDNQDGTVTDNVTGLMWQNSGMTGATGGIGANGVCATLRLAGYTDWRLPTLVELISLVDYDRASGPMIDTAAFPSTPSYAFWTSVPFKSSTPPPNAESWFVSFVDGTAGNMSDGHGLDIRCVR